MNGQASTPDIMALAKALGGGFPIGACLATAEAGKGMTVGTHGSTFGGNPLAMAVGNAVLDVVLAPGFLDHVRDMSLLLKQRLAEVKDRHSSIIAEVRGEGLLHRLAHAAAGLRHGRRIARREDDHGRRRRQCRAAAAAADHQRSRDRRGDGAHRPRLRAAGADACAGEGGGVMTDGLRHFLDLIDIPSRRSPACSMRAAP